MSSTIAIDYLFQIDQKNYIFRKNEINSGFTFNYPNEQINKIIINAKLSSYNYKQNLSSITKSATLSGTMHIFKEWILGLEIIENFQKKKNKPIEKKIKLEYNGQCTNIALSLSQNNTSDIKRNILKSKKWYPSIEIHLKNIN